MKNPAAVALGKMAKGVPKNFSRAERARRKKLMEAMNKKRREKSSEARMPNKSNNAEVSGSGGQ